MRDAGVMTVSHFPFGENFTNLAPSAAMSISSSSSSSSSSSPEVSRISDVGRLIFLTRRASEEEFGLAGRRWNSLIWAIVEIARMWPLFSGRGVMAAEVMFSSFCYTQVMLVRKMAYQLEVERGRKRRVLYG